MSKHTSRYLHDKWRGLSRGKTRLDFDLPSLCRGMNVEMEHTDDAAIAERIAMDHLTEDPNYYVKLAKMEGARKQRIPAHASGDWPVEACVGCGKDVVIKRQRDGDVLCSACVRVQREHRQKYPKLPKILPAKKQIVCPDCEGTGVTVTGHKCFCM